MSKDLFGNDTPTPPPSSKGLRNKDGSQKNNPMLAAYGAKEGFKCKTCEHLERWEQGKTWFKCALRKKGHVSTDHRMNWPACNMYEEEQNE